MEEQGQRNCEEREGLGLWGRKKGNGGGKMGGWGRGDPERISDYPKKIRAG